jgi:hypothetical protein
MGSPCSIRYSANNLQSPLDQQTAVSNLQSIPNPQSVDPQSKDRTLFAQPLAVAMFRIAV